MRSPITSRSNWAKLSKTFSVSLPILFVVLNDCVMLTKVHVIAFENLNQLGKIQQGSAEAVKSSRRSRYRPARLYVGDQPPQSRPLQRAARKATVIVAVWNGDPAFGFLAYDVGLALALTSSELNSWSSPSSDDLRV